MKNHFFPFLEIFFFQKQLACLLASKGKLALEVYVWAKVNYELSTAGQSRLLGGFTGNFSTSFSPRPSPIVLPFVLDSARGCISYFDEPRLRKNLQKKKKHQKINCHVYFLALQLLRQLWCMMDSTSPAHLSSLETRISSNLLRLRALFFGGTYFGLNCSKITLKNSFFFYRRFWKSVYPILDKKSCSSPSFGSLVASDNNTHEVIGNSMRMLFLYSHFVHTVCSK